jgi:hypothetical protein
VTMAACPLTSIDILRGCAAFSMAAPLAKRGPAAHFWGMTDENIVRDGFW